MDEFLEKQRSPPPRPLLLQEKPVHHISNTIPPCDILPTSFSPLRPHQGVAGSCLWEGRQDGQRHLALGSLNLDGPPPSPPSFPPPPPPPPSPPPSSRPLARTALRVRTVNLRDFAEVTRVSPTWPHSSRRTTTEGGGCHCHDRLTAIALRHVHLPPHFHLRARFPTTPTAPTSGQRGAGRRTRTWGSISLATSLRRRDITIHLVEKLYRVLYMGE